MLVESGGGLLGRLFKEDLVDEALVFTSPVLLGDDSARGPVRGFEPQTIGEGIQLTPVWTRHRDPDLVSRLLVRRAAD